MMYAVEIKVYLILTIRFVELNFVGRFSMQYVKFIEINLKLKIITNRNKLTALLCFETRI